MLGDIINSDNAMDIDKTIDLYGNETVTKINKDEDPLAVYEELGKSSNTYASWYHYAKTII